MTHMFGIRDDEPMPIPHFSNRTLFGDVVCLAQKAVSLADTAIWGRISCTRPSVNSWTSNLKSSLLQTAQGNKSLER
jgi:hypothetical protein